MNNNYESTIESFIDFCDEMHIAEEGLFSSIFSKIMKISEASKSTKKEDIKKVKLPKENTKKSTIKKQKEPRIAYVNKTFLETLEYNGWDMYDEYTNTEYKLMTPEQEKKCSDAVNMYKKYINKFKAVVAKANSKAGGNYCKFINEALSKYDVIYDEKNNKVSVSGYPIGYEYFEEGWKNKELSEKINKAWDIMDQDIANVAGKYQCNMCKPNCDGYPEYCYDYHRFYWFIIEAQLF